MCMLRSLTTSNDGSQAAASVDRWLLDTGLVGLLLTAYLLREGFSPNSRVPPASQEALQTHSHHICSRLHLLKTLFTFLLKFRESLGHALLHSSLCICLELGVYSLTQLRLLCLKLRLVFALYSLTLTRSHESFPACILASLFARRVETLLAYASDFSVCTLAWSAAKSWGFAAERVDARDGCWARLAEIDSRLFRRASTCLALLASSSNVGDWVVEGIPSVD